MFDNAKIKNLYFEPQNVQNKNRSDLFFTVFLLILVVVRVPLTPTFLQSISRENKKSWK
jgi:hypothetical protein